MDKTTSKPYLEPKTMAELLPVLRGILHEDCMQTYTAKKQPRNHKTLTYTSEKAFQPLTMAEIRNTLMALEVKPSPRRPQSNNTLKKRQWNSSVKVDKTINHTKNGQLKNNSVRKELKFLSKPKTNVNKGSMNIETPKFPKPELKVKKTLHLQAKNSVRISGISNIPETPAIKCTSLYKNRMTIANKENVSRQVANVTKVYKAPITKLPLPLKKPLASVSDTPLSNMSWTSSCDASFLQTEKELQDKIDTFKTLEHPRENKAKISPPVSTPLKEYRNIQDVFNNTCYTEDSVVYNDNTIMCFDTVTISKENSERDKSVIVSLCDMLNKATVSNCDKRESEVNDLLKVEKETADNIEMIDTVISRLTKMKESQLKSLQYIRKLIDKNCNTDAKNGEECETTKESEHEVKTETMEVESSPCSSKPHSVIKHSSKSPSYKIPKKNLCLRKKVFHKSMPNVSNGMHTPNSNANDKALNIYMKMKEKMNFLNTPIVKHNRTIAQNSPAVTSQNLQIQLNRLYN